MQSKLRGRIYGALVSQPGSICLIFLTEDENRNISFEQDLVEFWRNYVNRQWNNFLFFLQSRKQLEDVIDVWDQFPESGPIQILEYVFYVVHDER